MKTAVRKLQPPRQRGDFTGRLAATAATPAKPSPMPTSRPAISPTLPSAETMIETKPTGDAQSAPAQRRRGRSGISRPAAVALVAAYATVLALIAGGSLVQAPPVPLQPGNSSPTASPDLTAPESSAQETDDHLSGLSSTRPTSRIFRRGGASPDDTLATVCGTPVTTPEPAAQPAAAAEIAAANRNHVALVRDVTGKTIALILTRIASPVSAPVGSPTDTSCPTPSAPAIPQHI